MSALSRSFAWTVVSLLLISAQAHSEEYSTTIYESGSNRQNVLFKMKRVDRFEGNKKFLHSVYAYPDGREAAIEDVVLQDGKLLSFKLDQKQLGEVRTAEFKDGELKYSLFKDGKTETGSEKPEGNWLVGAQIVPFAISRWDGLVKGEEASFRIVVLERMETIGFKFVKDEERSDANTLVLLMKPTSFIINALVEPLVFRFDMKSRKFLSVVGRTTLKLQKNGKWKDFDGETVAND